MSDTTTTAADAPRPVPPTPLLSRANETSSANSRPSRRRSKTESSIRKAERMQWVDIDQRTISPRQRKRAFQISTSSPLKGQPRSRNSTESELGRFLPRLARILESGESSTVSSNRIGRRSNSYKGQQRDTNDDHPRRSGRSTESGASRRRSPAKHKVSRLHRRADTVPGINPSLLSVLSSLTRASDHSSSSGTTITQESYDKKGPQLCEGLDRDQNLNTETELFKIDDQPNVYDFIMDTASSSRADDARSLRSSSSSASPSSSSSSSSSSSHYEPSIGSSNEVPESPSSHSTYGSPTSTRDSSLAGSIGVAELRSKYDSRNISSSGPGSGGSLSPKGAGKRAKISSQVHDILEDEESDYPSSLPPSFDEVLFDAGQPSKCCSVQSTPSEGRRLKQQQDAMRHYVAESQQCARPTGNLCVDQAYGPRRSSSSSSAGSSRSQRTWQEYMAMQQCYYQQQQQQNPHSALPALQEPIASQPDSTIEPLPQVPDAPDLTKTTLTGYELLAREFTTHHSPLKPMYRKFSYLNHRLLLHMQDELQEMEETLRLYDEILAQTECNPTVKEQSPASRRSRRSEGGKEGSEVHYRRTMLLGNIYRKMGQYRERLREFADGGVEGLTRAEGEEVRVLREWIKERGLGVERVREVLSEEGDLVVLGERGREREGTGKGASGGGGIVVEPRELVSMVVLPMLLGAALVSLITSRSGCLVLMVLAAVGAAVVYFNTELRKAMSGREALK